MKDYAYYRAKWFKRSRRVLLSLTVAAAVMTFIVVLNVANGTSAPGIALILVVGAIATPMGIWISGQIWKTPPEESLTPQKENRNGKA